MNNNTLNIATTEYNHCADVCAHMKEKTMELDQKHLNIVKMAYNSKWKANTLSLTHCWLAGGIHASDYEISSITKRIP